MKNSQNDRFTSFNRSLINFQQTYFLRHLETDFSQFAYLEDDSIPIVLKFVKSLSQADARAFAAGLQKRGMVEPLLPKMGLTFSNTERDLVNLYSEMLSQLPLSNHEKARQPQRPISPPSLTTVVTELGVHLGCRPIADRKSFSHFRLELDDTTLVIALDRSQIANAIRIWLNVVDGDGRKLNYFALSPPLSLAGICAESRWTPTKVGLADFCEHTATAVREIKEWLITWKLEYSA